MYFHLSEHIRITYFNEEIVLLNLLRDQYIVLHKKLAVLLMYILKNEFKHKNGKYIRINALQSSEHSCDVQRFISYLLLEQILTSCIHKQAFPNIPQQQLLCIGGLSNVNWRLSKESLSKKISKKLFFEAYLCITVVHIIVKFKGFYKLIKYIKSKSKNDVVYTTESIDRFNILVAALDKACFLYPYKTKCLEWSAALVLMGIKRRWKCNLIIGVQNIPFQAHAWVESGSEIIADSQNLFKEMSIILSEPFGKYPLS